MNEQLTQRHHQRRHRRDQATRQARRTPVDTAHTVAGEDLNTKAGTASAKGTWPEPEAEGRTARQPAGARRARPRTEAGQGEPGAYFTNMQPVRPRPQDPPTVADTICVWPAGSKPTPTTVRGDLDAGADGTFLWDPFRGAGQGLPHGQGASPWGIPATREPDGVEVPSGRCDP